jgi:hypothetical protein
MSILNGIQYGRRPAGRVSFAWFEDPQLFTIALDDEVGATETVAQTETKIVSDVIVALDARVVTVTKMLSDAFSASETTAFATTRGLTETLVLTDAFTRLLQKTLTETLGLSDSVSRQITKAFSDSVGLADSPVVFATTRTLREILSVVDAAISTITTKRLTETVRLNDWVAVTFNPVTNWGHTTSASITWTKDQGILLLARPIFGRVGYGRTIYGFDPENGRRWVEIKDQAPSSWTKF